jgi:MFS family permease
MIPLWRTLMFLWWQRHEGWAYRARYLFGFQLLLPAAALIIVFNSSYALFLVAFAIAGVGMSMTYVSSIYYSLDSDHSHEHRSGMHEAALGSGSAVAPPLAGLIARTSGWDRSPYVFAFALLLVSLCAQALLYLRALGNRPRFHTTNPCSFLGRKP